MRQVTSQQCTSSTRFGKAKIVGLGAVLIAALLVGFLFWRGCQSKPDPLRFSHSYAEVIGAKGKSTAVKIDDVETAIDRVDLDLTFTTADGTTWTAPTGTWTDWASVPSDLTSLTGRPDNPLIARAALIHDAYCQEFTLVAGDKPFRTGNYRVQPWQQTHLMFHDACLAGGASENQARLWWAAVHVGGPRWDEQGRDIPNSLSNVTREVVVALFYGPNLVRKSKFPSRSEIETKLAEYQRNADESLRYQHDAIDSVERDKIQECATIVETATSTLNSKAKENQPDQIVYQALAANFSEQVGRKLDESGHYPEAVKLYGKARLALSHIDIENDALTLIRSAELAVRESELHRELNDFNLSNDKLKVAEEQFQNARIIAPEIPELDTLRLRIQTQTKDLAL